MSTVMRTVETYRLFMRVLDKISETWWQDIAFSFSYSAKKTCKFQEYLDITQHELGKRKKLRDICETMWSDSLFTFLIAFDVIIDALEDLQEDGDNKARGRLRSIFHFDFISLVIGEHVL